MQEVTMKNARITKTYLGSEDHGPIYYLYLDYGGAGQAFGGYTLCTGFTHDAIFDLLKTLEVENWEKLPETFVRVHSDSRKIYNIGHVLKDKWFSLADLALERQDKDEN